MSAAAVQKMLPEFVGMEQADRKARLDDGCRPDLADLDRLTKTCRKIYESLHQNELVD